MKFAKSLQRNEVPEWSQFYIDYKGLKKLVNQAARELKNASAKTSASAANGIAHGAANGAANDLTRPPDVHTANGTLYSGPPLSLAVDPQVDDSITAPFFFAVDRNVETVDSFYNAKFAEYVRRLRHVDQQVQLLWQQLNHDETEEAEKDEMAGMLLELRAQLRNLQWYAEVNKRGFTKILKKFDKKIGTRAKSYYLSSKIHILGFSNGEEIGEKVDAISKMLRDIAPHLGQNGNGQGTGPFSSSNTSLNDTETPFDALKLAVDRNDVAGVHHGLATVPLNGKQALMLVIRAVTMHADDVIPLLAEPHALELTDVRSDINRRNIVHKVVIAEGRQVGEHLKREIDVGKHTKQTVAVLPAKVREKSPVDHRSAKSLGVLLQSLGKRQSVATLLLTVDLQLRAPLHYAVRYGLAGTAQLLLSLEPSALKFADADNSTPLDLAVINKHPFTLKELLHYSPPPIPELLLTATRLNAVAVCEQLLDHGYDVDFQNPSSGETALHLAARYGHLEVVKLLIERHANLEVRENTFQWTPLFVAAVDGSQDIADCLLKAGARADILDHSGWSAKEHAALRGHLTLAKKLPSPVNEASQQPQPSSHSAMKSSTEKREVVDTVLKTFGHRYLEDSEEHVVFVTLGSRDLRKTHVYPVNLDTVPMTEAGKTQLDTALSLVVSATPSAGGESFPVDLPVSEFGLATEPLPFFTKHLSKLRLVFDLVPTYSTGSNVLARGVFILPPITRMDDLNRKVCTIPIIESASMRVLGEVNFEYIVVKPFPHPLNGLNVSTTYWRSLITTRVIGHRGLGKNTLEKSSLQLGENTVESFIQAANLGASYVEFDVQITKDSVPVIYHDFVVGDSGFDVPMHALSYDQFMNIQEHEERGRKREKSPQEDNLFLGPKRSRSVHEQTSSSYEDALQRMRHTRDFQKRGYKGNVRGLHIQSKFATLEELFKTLPDGLGFNIEFKYPMQDEAESEEMDGTVVEINHFVDTILNVIFDHKRGRDVILSSFNPDVCILLSLKQPSIPVLFLTEAGTEPMYDVRASSLQEAIRFARRFNLLGIVSGAQPLIMCPRLVRAVKENGLVCFTYGTDNNVPENARIQLEAGVDAVIADSVLAIREELTNHELRTEEATPKAESIA